MKAETRDLIISEVEGWEYLKSLPVEWFGFTKEYEGKEIGDVYDILTYKDANRRRKVTIYYHDETKEYKLRLAVGLTEFCKEDFITADIVGLEKVMRERFADLLQRLAVFDEKNIDSIVLTKKIRTWAYLEKYPDNIAGFELFIRPNEPFRSINGSYIVFDYSDFANESNFIIYYNIFRDEFFGEAKVRNIPEVNYLFDSHELKELEEKLDLYLIPRLEELRKKIIKETE